MCICICEKDNYYKIKMVEYMSLKIDFIHEKNRPQKMQVASMKDAIVHKPGNSHLNP